MASLQKTWHKVETDGADKKIWLPDLYETIGAAVGITKMTPEEAERITDSIGVSNGLMTGQLIRLSLTVRDVATGKPKSAQVLCSVTKVRTAISQLTFLKYRGNPIRSARVPRRRRLG